MHPTRTSLIQPINTGLCGGGRRRWGEEEKGAHLAEDGDDPAGRGISGEGEAKNLWVLGGVQQRLVGVGEGWNC
jgi:hypothetical protein